MLLQLSNKNHFLFNLFLSKNFCRDHPALSHTVHAKHFYPSDESTARVKKIMQLVSKTQKFNCRGLLPSSIEGGFPQQGPTPTCDCISGLRLIPAFHGVTRHTSCAYCCTWVYLYRDATLVANLVIFANFFC